MPPAAPQHCRPEAYAALAAALPDLPTTDGLLAAVAAVSLHELHGEAAADATAPAVIRQLDELARTIAERLQSSRPDAVLAHAHAVLFDEARFGGPAAADYHDPDSSYLSRVLQTRRGLPLTLVLIYKGVLERLGLPVHGINAPGHFLAAVNDRGHGPAMLVDPYHGGRVLTVDDAYAQIERIAGGAVRRDPALLQRATHPQWLLRHIQNLVTAFERRDRPDHVHAMLELCALVTARSD